MINCKILKVSRPKLHRRSELIEGIEIIIALSLCVWRS